MQLVLSSSIYVAVQFVLFGIAIPKGVAAASAGQPAAEKFSLTTQSVSAPSKRRLPTTVHWKEEKYDIETGINVLMEVIGNKESAEDDRTLAISLLAMLKDQLRDNACLDGLTRGFGSRTPVQKSWILKCYMGSGDPRGIPLFTRVLDNEKSVNLRLNAAAGLAQWNVRSGVAELIRLMGSDESMPNPGHTVLVRDNALTIFRSKNRTKGWGFPERQWWTEPEVLAATGETKRAIYKTEVAKDIADIQNWFSENEHRFPEWKFGDPLPEIDKPDSASDNDN